MPRTSPSLFLLPPAQTYIYGEGIGEFYSGHVNWLIFRTFFLPESPRSVGSRAFRLRRVSRENLKNIKEVLFRVNNVNFEGQI